MPRNSVSWMRLSSNMVRILFSSGVKVVVENKAIMYLLGTKMDYVEDDLKAEFVFSNPNSKGSCGCGESFNV
jgi:iron-sulfur cluster assembly protein